MAVPLTAPLYQAIPSLHLVRLLVEHGAEVGKCPLLLHTLVWDSHGDIEPLVDYLLEHGADFHTPDPLHWNALHSAMAVAVRCYERECSTWDKMVRLYLSKGADPNWRSGTETLERARDEVHRKLTKN